MEIITGILSLLGGFVSAIFGGIGSVFSSDASLGQTYTTVARYVFIALALFILLRSIVSLIRSKNPSEVWAYLHINEDQNLPLTHWENVLGRTRSSDIRIDDMSVSRNHGTLTRDNDGMWKYMDLGSKNGALLNGRRIRPTAIVRVRIGDVLQLGASTLTLLPISLEEKRNNQIIREEYTVIPLPWLSLLAITVFQIMTVIQLHISLGDKYVPGITYAFLGMCILMSISLL